MRKRFFIAIVLVAALIGGAAKAAPQRLISLVPSITENLFALGVGDRIVGVTSFCDYPLAAQEKDVIGDALSLDLELILALEPDLIIGDSTLVAGHLEQLAALGLPLFSVGPANLEEVQDSLISLGEAVGEPQRGRELAAAMAQRLQELGEKGKRAHKPRVFVEVWNEPLMSAGPGSFMHELIVLAGGENIATDSANPWPLFSEELVIERDPQVLILTGFNKEEVLARAPWQEISAIKSGFVFEVDPDLYARTTPRLLDALQEMIQILDQVGQ